MYSVNYFLGRFVCFSCQHFHLYHSATRSPSSFKAADVDSCIQTRRYRASDASHWRRFNKSGSEYEGAQCLWQNEHRLACPVRGIDEMLHA